MRSAPPSSSSSSSSSIVSYFFPSWVEMPPFQATINKGQEQQKKHISSRDTGLHQLRFWNQKREMSEISRKNLPSATPHHPPAPRLENPFNLKTSFHGDDSMQSSFFYIRLSPPSSSSSSSSCCLLFLMADSIIGYWIDRPRCCQLWQLNSA